MKFILSVILTTLISISSFATDTKIIVRAKAKDAKFIGSSLGGAKVVIRNKKTQTILVQGKTEGATGNTNTIMNTPLKRGERITDDNTAKFQATIPLSEPVFVTIEVYSTIKDNDVRVSATTDLWLIPGKHILGEGIIIEIPGFLVTLDNSKSSQTFTLKELQKNPLKVTAKVVMMCGCPIEKNGMWDATQVEVKALIKLKDNSITEVPLHFKSTNTFEGTVNFQHTGDYEVIVYAYDSTTGNTGVDTAHYKITP
ncbi:hypothetical protein FNB79_11735 [Formosa sediminum]|uniref:Uncharacterized protein n=1 Tax=Formosa sediminum TaxID=2594004 RepID=A0A516GSV5_9FLAO|nr:hypothetical protein [Formosa sediminum]QDO94607.1 hypothetical protein FNB79_11735 [Formosa sediminum]